jgi:hypothetical protein
MSQQAILLSHTSDARDKRPSKFAYRGALVAINNRRSALTLTVIATSGRRSALTLTVINSRRRALTLTGNQRPSPRADLDGNQ